MQKEFILSISLNKAMWKEKDSFQLEIILDERKNIFRVKCDIDIGIF